MGQSVFRSRFVVAQNALRDTVHHAQGLDVFHHASAGDLLYMAALCQRIRAPDLRLWWVHQAEDDWQYRGHKVLDEAKVAGLRAVLNVQDVKSVALRDLSAELFVRFSLLRLPNVDRTVSKPVWIVFSTGAGGRYLFEYVSCLITHGYYVVLAVHSDGAPVRTGVRAGLSPTDTMEEALEELLAKYEHTELQLVDLSPRNLGDPQAPLNFLDTDIGGTRRYAAWAPIQHLANLEHALRMRPEVLAYASTSGSEPSYVKHARPLFQNFVADLLCASPCEAARAATRYKNGILRLYARYAGVDERVWEQRKKDRAAVLTEIENTLEEKGLSGKLKPFVTQELQRPFGSIDTRGVGACVVLHMLNFNFAPQQFSVWSGGQWKFGDGYPKFQNQGRTNQTGIKFDIPHAYALFRGFASL